MGIAPMKYWSISSEILVNEAKKLGMEVEIVDKEKNTFFISHKGKKVLFKSTDFGGNSALGYKLADDKGLSYKILEYYGLPIAKTWYCNPSDIKNIDSLDMDFPVIIKPLSEGHGNGVKMNIIDINGLRKSLADSFKEYDTMIIQRQISGPEYRFLVVKGEVILVRERDPAHVYGDGVHTIEKLIEIENDSNPLRGDGYNLPLSFIKTDSELIAFIEKQKLSLKSIPEKDTKIYLRGNSNIGTGGISINRSEMVHSSINEIVCKTAEYFGLEIAGIDIISSDITKPLSETGGVILEINATPGIGGDIELTGINTGRIILEKLFF